MAHIDAARPYRLAVVPGSTARPRSHSTRRPARTDDERDGVTENVRVMHENGGLLLKRYPPIGTTGVRYLPEKLPADQIPQCDGE